ncbi:MAG: methyltransferase domain-containing protein [Candidatus Aenigmarchaeota archaeon]|nr:methyltransferase domain-containing protein [Candidatus Aenigmarchaeota archaeon]
MAGKDAEVKRKVRETYDYISDHFNVTRNYMWKECAGFIEKAPEASAFLDVGCGNGRNSFHALKHSFSVVSCDISSAQLKVVRTKAGNDSRNLHLVQCDASSLPLKPASFDHVLFIAAIHHLPTEKERIESLEEIGRVLKPEGKVLVSAWAFDQPRFKGINEEKRDIILKWDKRYDRFYHLFCKGELEDICRKAGFDIISSFRAQDNYYVEMSKRY